MFQHWNHFGDYLCRITDPTITTLPSSHLGQIDIMIPPVVDIVLTTVLSRVEELPEDRPPRLIVVVAVRL